VALLKARTSVLPFHTLSSICPRPKQTSSFTLDQTFSPSLILALKNSLGSAPPSCHFCPAPPRLRSTSLSPQSSSLLHIAPSNHISLTTLFASTSSCSIEHHLPKAIEISQLFLFERPRRPKVEAFQPCVGPKSYSKGSRGMSKLSFSKDVTIRSNSLQIRSSSLLWHLTSGYQTLGQFFCGVPSLTTMHNSLSFHSLFQSLIDSFAFMQLLTSFPV
jgi:hypothetical protein